MTRRQALVLAAASVATIVITLLVVSPGSRVARVRAEGTLSPASAGVGLPADATARVGSPGSSVTTIPTTIPVLPAPAPDPGPASDPVALTIGAIGVSAPIVPVGFDPGTDSIDVPPISEVGWYRYGPRPGEPGSSVLVGHVDGNGRTGIFWELRDLVPGQTATVRYADGSSRAFVISGRAELAKDALPASLFSRQGPPQLALITCGGAFDTATHHYVDNVVVVATPQLP